jgi:hypothetical protein
VIWGAGWCPLALARQILLDCGTRKYRSKVCVFKMYASAQGCTYCKVRLLKKIPTTGDTACVNVCRGEARVSVAMRCKRGKPYWRKKKGSGAGLCVATFPLSSALAKPATDCGNRLQCARSRDGCADWLWCHSDFSSAGTFWFQSHTCVAQGLFPQDHILASRRTCGTIWTFSLTVCFFIPPQP